MRLRPIVLWSNLLYLVAVAVALGVAAGLQGTTPGTPWRAHVNVAIVAVVAAATGLLNVRCLRRGRWSAASVVAVVLNLVALAYLFLKPRYEFVAIEVAIVSIPILNIAFLAGDLRSSRRLPASTDAEYRRP